MSDRSSQGALDRFRRWFWQPPRRHGEVITDRTVSFLELFYDLVYVVVIGQAAHHLAEHVSLVGAVQFIAVFGLIWTAWVNGSLYLELHGREDGRTRAFVFVQMGILAVLAAFTADATGSTGRPFALTYVAFLVVLTWLWYSVRRRDAPEFMGMTGVYLAGMVASIGVIGVSAFLADGPRLAVWLSFTLAWALGLVYMGRRFGGTAEQAVTVTDSMVERFGLFTIIVLGEVVVGVVDGLAAAGGDALAIATGMAALVIGFGFWWIYFDFIGRRFPRPGAMPRYAWIVGHMPVCLTIAAAGAGMVTLIEHAGTDRTPAGAAWLLAGSVATGLVAMAALSWFLVDYRRLGSVYRPLTGLLLGGAAAALLVGWAAPPPLLLALLLVAVLVAIWLVAFKALLTAEQNGEAHPAPG